MKDCCKKEEIRDLGEIGGVGEKKGIFQGIVYGILPHSFCIAFIVFTVIGSTLATSLLKGVLLTPYFFQLLIGLSFVFAMISAVIYLRRKKQLSLGGIRANWGYLGILFGTTIAVNLLLFLVIFPKVANNIGGRKEIGEIRGVGNIREVTLKVKIPCSGHAPLISGEIRAIKGIKDVRFVSPNIFEVSYDQNETEVAKILGLEVFKTYPAVVK